MKASEREVALVQRLLDLTRQGAVPWEETADDLAYQATLGKVTVVVHSSDIEGDIDYFVEVLNANGQIADTLYPYPLEDGGMSNARAVVREIYTLGRRFALKADDTVDEALKELDLLAS